MNAMKDELASMHHNDVQYLEGLPNKCESFGCKYVFKRKKNAYGELKGIKPNLQQKCILKGKALIIRKYFHWSQLKIPFKL